MKKKISLFLTAIMMIAMLLPAFAQAEEIAYADTIRWDAQYDVVVVGFGGAGATSAIAAVEEGANVLLTEKRRLGMKAETADTAIRLF